MRQGPEHIPVVVEDSYEEIARQVAQRIAELIRGRAGQRVVLGLATGSTPVGIYRELIRLHREEGSRLLQRRDLQPRRVLPDGPREPPQLPPLHLGELLRARQRSPRERAHPARRHSPGPGRGALPPVRAGHRGRRRHRLRDPRHRPDRTHRLQRARLGRALAHPSRDPRHGHATQRRRGLLRHRERAPRGHHDGRGDDPRSEGDRAGRDRRAQGRHLEARGRGRDRPLRGGHVLAGAPERHGLPGRRGRRRAHPEEDALGAGRDALDPYA